MFNFKQIRYTLRHRKAFREIERKLLGRNTLRGYLHDLDKVFLYLIFDYQKVHKWHRAYSKHHSVKAKTKEDFIQMVIDWECARYTKPDKPLNAYETLNKFYPQLSDKIMPILRLYNLDHNRELNLENGWDKDYIHELYIGFDDSMEHKSYSAVKVFRDKGEYSVENVSENKNLYWCNCPYINISILINKDCEEGKTITKMIDERKSDVYFDTFLIDTAVSHMTYKQFMYCMKIIENAGYTKGYHDKSYEVIETINRYSPLEYNDI